MAFRKKEKWARPKNISMEYKYTRYKEAMDWRYQDYQLLM